MNLRRKLVYWASEAAELVSGTAAVTARGTVTAGRVVGDAAVQATHLTVQAATSRVAKKAAVLVGKAVLTSATTLAVTAFLGPIAGSLAAGVTGGAMGLGNRAEGGTPPHV